MTIENNRGVLRYSSVIFYRNGVARYTFETLNVNNLLMLFNETRQRTHEREKKRQFFVVVIFQIQAEHLQFEHLQSTHEQAEPQLVFSSVEKNIDSNIFSRGWIKKQTYANMICSHICMSSYHRIYMSHLDIQHHIHNLQLNSMNSWKKFEKEHTSLHWHWQDLGIVYLLLNRRRRRRRRKSNDRTDDTVWLFIVQRDIHPCIFSGGAVCLIEPHPCRWLQSMFIFSIITCNFHGWTSIAILFNVYRSFEKRVIFVIRHLLKS